MNYKELKYFDNVYILKYLEDLKIVKERNHYEICKGMCIDLSEPICIDCNGSKELDKKFCKNKRKIKGQVYVIIVINLVF